MNPAIALVFVQVTSEFTVGFPSTGEGEDGCLFFFSAVQEIKSLQGLFSACGILLKAKSLAGAVDG